jgi:hypothetical protein
VDAVVYDGKMLWAIQSTKENGISKWHSKVFTRLQINKAYEQLMVVQSLRGER